MTTRNVIVLVVVTAALSALFSFSVAAGGLHRGPEGPEGPAGPQGPAGTSVDARAVRQAVDDDPDAIGKALSGHLDYEDIRTSLGLDESGAPAGEAADTAAGSAGTDAASRDDLDELRSDLDDLRRKVEDLCTALADRDPGADLGAC